MSGRGTRLDRAGERVNGDITAGSRVVITRCAHAGPCHPVLRAGVRDGLLGRLVGGPGSTPAVRGLAGLMQAFPAARSACGSVADALTYAGQTTGPDGQVMDVEARLAEMVRRHGRTAPTPLCSRSEPRPLGRRCTALSSACAPGADQSHTGRVSWSVGRNREARCAPGQHVPSQS